MVEVVRETATPSLSMLFQNRPPAGLIFRHGRDVSWDAFSGWYPQKFRPKAHDCVAYYFSSSELFRIYLCRHEWFDAICAWAERAERLSGATVTLIEVATKAELEAAMAGF